MVISSQHTPGIYREEVFPTIPPILQTGVPAFLGFTQKGNINTPQLLTLWPQFEENLGSPLSDSYLGYAVRGFFENGGSLCYVVPLDKNLTVDDALSQGLAAIASLDTIDLVCAPDLMQGNPNLDTVLRLQNTLLQHCQVQGDRFAILDPFWSSIDLNLAQSIQEVKQQGQGLGSKNGALYYPWIKVAAINPGDEAVWVPPCGHIAGIYARSDGLVGVHKAPANEPLENVLDLKFSLTNMEQDILNPLGVNCLRVFPGRGMRVWGAKTLSNEPNWIYVNVRRIFLTVGRWLELNLADLAFEPNDLRLWVRIERELTAYFSDLLRQGALRGTTEQASFYVKCDAETNPPEIREAGMAIAEIGLAAAVPMEFITVRIILGASGVTLAD